MTFVLTYIKDNKTVEEIYQVEDRNCADKMIKKIEKRLSKQGITQFSINYPPMNILF